MDDMTDERHQPRRDRDGQQDNAGQRRGYGSRDERPRREGEREQRGYGNRDGGRPAYQGNRPRVGDDRADRPRGRGDTPRMREEDRPPLHPGLERKENEPPVPQGVDLRVLPFGVRAELRGLRKDIAEEVGAHLVAAGELIDENPELALAHAQAARRRAARLPVVREATAETAYAAGDFATALTEYRALRRMTGGADYLPVMADCERALGRPENALKLARESRDEELSNDMRVEMVLVEAGARDDLKQGAEALRILKQAISAKLGDKAGQARLRYAYADLLEAAGDETGARQWFQSAERYDTDEQLDASQRIAKLDGMVIEFDEALDEEEADEPTQNEPSETDGE